MPPHAQPDLPLLRRQALRVLGACIGLLVFVAVADGYGLGRALDAWLAQEVYGASGPTAGVMDIGPWLRWILLALTALVLVLIEIHLNGLVLLSTVLLSGTIMLGVDYLLRTEAHVGWGAGNAFLMLLATAVASGLVDSQRTADDLRSIRSQLRRRSRAIAGQKHRVDRDMLLAGRFAELCRDYVECSSSLLAELPSGHWHLQFKAFFGSTESMILEVRRDARRMPYQEAFATMTPTWRDDFLVTGPAIRSLLVPLGTVARPLGLWVINFPAEQALSRIQADVVQQLAGQLALALEASPRGLGPRTLLERLLLAEPDRPHLQTLARSVQTMADGQAWLVALLDAAPMCVLAASVWGDVEFTNEAMREALQAAGAKGQDDQHLAQVLALLSGLPQVTVMARLRDLVAGGPNWQFSSRFAPGRAAFVLKRWPPAGAADGERQPGQFLLTAALPNRMALQPEAVA